MCVCVYDSEGHYHWMWSIRPCNIRTRVISGFSYVVIVIHGSPLSYVLFFIIIISDSTHGANRTLIVIIIIVIIIIIIISIIIIIIT